MPNTTENTAENEEIVILTGDNCPPCDRLKKILKDSDTNFQYRFVDVNSEEGKKIVEEGTERLKLPLALRVKRRVEVKEYDIFNDKETVLLQDKEGNIVPLKE